jgi:hypothetical protein
VLLQEKTLVHVSEMKSVESPDMTQGRNDAFLDSSRLMVFQGCQMIEQGCCVLQELEILLNVSHFKQILNEKDTVLLD